MTLIDIDKLNIEDIPQTSLEPMLDGIWCQLEDIIAWLQSQPVIKLQK